MMQRHAFPKISARASDGKSMSCIMLIMLEIADIWKYPNRFSSARCLIVFASEREVAGGVRRLSSFKKLVNEAVALPRSGGPPLLLPAIDAVSV